MATVKSLGLHHPAGLQHAIDEDLLPSNPPADAYTWRVVEDEIDGTKIEDELLITKDSVIWSRGSLFRKTYKFDVDKEPITQAIFAFFPTPEDERGYRPGRSGGNIGQESKKKPAPAANKTPGLDKALVVFLKTQAHIYFLSGTSHTVHIPFEVESAIAAPVGIIIQQKYKAQNAGPISLKFPRVPPNSFVSSQLTALNSSQQSTFSVENLGNPKALNLGAGSTMANLWDAQIEQPPSHWPRLVSLIDPLLDIGLVVSDKEAENPRGAKRRPSKRPSFLDASEELLHIEKVTLPGAEPLTIAITLQREANVYSIWRLTYLKHEDPFIKRKKKADRRVSRRRSSMQPGLNSGTTTPVQPLYRESFGAPLPGKRTRKSEKVEKPLDLVSSLEQQTKEDNGVKRRTSRRVSSMLARADLSVSHERSTFSEQVGGHAGTSKRHDSLGSHQGRMSSQFNQTIHPSLGSLLEAPLDFGLDEGINNMGLDDRDFDGMQHEIMLTKVHSVPMEASSLRYSHTDELRGHCKVFIIAAPPFANNERSRSQLLIGIQDSAEKRLQLVTLHLKLQPKSDASKQTDAKTPSVPAATVVVTPGELRRAQNVVDSCKLFDGDHSVILILSESRDGRHELSTQAPWSELTKVSLSLMFADNTKSLLFNGRSLDRDVRQRKSEIMDVSNGSVVGLRHPRRRGRVDVLDREGRLHQLRVQLQPATPQVARILATCNSILPDSLGGRVHAGWLHVMQWLGSRDDQLINLEWSAVTVLLLCIFLNLGQPDTQTFHTTTRLPIRRVRPGSGTFVSIKDSDDWKALEAGETTHSLGCPVWMMNRGWEWTMDDDRDDAMSSSVGDLTKFIPRHIMLAREFMTSSQGEAALGTAGFLPTSYSRSPEARQRHAIDLFMGLHLLLEEQKLDIVTPEYSSPGRVDLRVVLCQIARWLDWEDYWSVYELGVQEDIDPRHDLDLHLTEPIKQPTARPDVMHWIQMRFTGQSRESYPLSADIFYANCQLPESEKKWDNRWDKLFPRTLTFKRFFKLLKRDSTAVDMVEAMHECGMTTRFLETLPEAILVPLQDAISLCQPHPPSTWSRELLELVKRGDISMILKPTARSRPVMSNLLAPTHTASWDFKLLCQSVDETNNLGYDEGEGTERQAVIRALFKEDRRLNEVQDLLSTHKTRVVRLDSQPDWPESVYLEKQHELVSTVAVGTLAIPAGRALLFFGLRYPLITQKFHISGFNLNCVVKPSNVTVGVDKTLFTEEKVCWGFFHQGVAAGLAISPQAKGIDSSWILYNKPAQELSNRHAGFLLALGLNGHLKGVAKWVAFKYLTPKHTMTSIGLLLGLAASYIGTMDSLITRLLSVHATRMLPRGAAELNLSPLTQTSGIMGIGLLYCNSQHRRMSEIMLSEIEHIDEEDEEEPLRSECYRLAAGFALGLINLGKGSDLKGLHDMRLTDKLIAHSTAAKKVEIVHILDRAAAGAVIAIALIFMKTEDSIVARKIDVPETVLQFDYVRPDILLLRTVAKNLILWSQIKPSFPWIQASLPSVYRSRYRLQGTARLRSTDLPFFSILAGLCFSIALRFSGSGSFKVRDLLLHYLDHFIRITRIPPTMAPHPDATPPYDEELTRSNARMCQDVVALSASIVMAGTGDIAVLRRLRSLHGRDDAETPYGSHLAAHLAIGSLFLGCGTVTFGTSNLAIAALLMAFYPVFPNDVMDNRSHLQAFRHFWVLATEQRCLVIKDIQTSQPVSVPVRITMKPHCSSHEPILYRNTPCLLPPLDQIATVSTDAGPSYWDVEVDLTTEERREAFSKTQSVYLRKRPSQEQAFPSTLRALGKENMEKSPFDWVFGLDALKGVSYAERATILEHGDDKAKETALSVDARMELERGIAEGGDRERLEGARLLFEWGSARDRLLKPTAGAHDSQATIKDGEQQDDGLDADGGGAWWMRSSAIEALKGQVMLITRGDDGL